MAQINSLFKMTGFPHHIIPLEMVSIPNSVDLNYNGNYNGNNYDGQYDKPKNDLRDLLAPEKNIYIYI
jgi:hypothetical protein